MMFVGYAERESDSMRVWDMLTSQVIVSHDVIWLKRMFFKDGATDIIDLDTLEDLETELGPESDIGLGTKNEDDITANGPSNNQPNKSGGTVKWGTVKWGTVKWGSPLVTGPCTMHTRAGRAIKPPDRLTYVPAVELRYLGEMAELDHGEIAKTYMACEAWKWHSSERAMVGV
jgi:hypothetical protein